MTTQNIGLMKAITAKMSYLNQRQGVLAQNIANADTPGYQARDLKEVDFSGVLKDVTRSSQVKPETTSANHIGGGGQIAPSEASVSKPDYEIAPAGNAVILEEQMLKMSRNMMDYNLMTTLYQKNVSMMRTALGSGN